MKIHSIYPTISGEVSVIPQGSFVTLLRLSNCNFCCSYCDAIDARNGVGYNKNVSDIYETITEFGNRNILITGGEPLLQEKELEQLVCGLAQQNYNVIIETNGSVNPYKGKYILWPFAYFVVDYKMPCSDHFFDMKLENFLELRNHDYVKFVCNDKLDVSTAIEISQLLINNGCKAKMAIGQTWEWLQKKDFNLFEFLLRNDLNYFVLNYQLHKMLNLD